MVVLDLSENNLVGELPSGLLQRLPQLEALRVDGNRLAGHIDVEILRAKCRVRIEKE